MLLKRKSCMPHSKVYILKFIVVTSAIVCLLLQLALRFQQSNYQRHTSNITNVENTHSEFIQFTEISSLHNHVRNNIPSPHVQHVNCQKIADGDEPEITKAEIYQKNNIHNIYNQLNIYMVTNNCTLFIKERHYAMKPLTQEEAEFPIAYNILMYKDPHQVERLLRAIYRPQNYYCIHIDKKSSIETVSTMKSITKCFDNVFLASKSIDVRWGYYSVLEPELVCMEDLWKYKKWKYLINLTGQEFPLKTNLDIVKILKALNGANAVQSSLKGREQHRYRTDFIHPGKKYRKAPFPLNVTLTKGAVHVILKREFVDYVLHNKTALLFRDWLKDSGHPDETLFNSLNHSPQLNVPGSYKGYPENSSKYPGLARVKNWSGQLWKCAGKYARAICIFGVGDLQHLLNKTQLFANKFHSDFHPLAYDCLEEIHFNMTREEVLGTRKFDVSFYEQLDVSHNHIE